MSHAKVPCIPHPPREKLLSRRNWKVACIVGFRKHRKALMDACEEHPAVVFAKPSNLSSAMVIYAGTEFSIQPIGDAYGRKGIVDALSVQNIPIIMSPRCVLLHFNRVCLPCIVCHAYTRSHTFTNCFGRHTQVLLVSFFFSFRKGERHHFAASPVIKSRCPQDNGIHSSSPRLESEGTRALFSCTGVRNTPTARILTPSLPRRRTSGCTGNARSNLRSPTQVVLLRVPQGGHQRRRNSTPCWVIRTWPGFFGNIATKDKRASRIILRCLNNAVVV